MIYKLPYQSEALLKPRFFKLRDHIDEKKDIIHLTVTHHYLQNKDTEDFYKMILKLDGKYRTQKGKWRSAPIKLRVIKQ